MQALNSGMYSTVLSHVACLSQNYALNRPASQSTSWVIGMPASEAVDGDLSENSVSGTDTGDLTPWWKVQLAAPIWVTHVEIHNRAMFGKYFTLATW